MKITKFIHGDGLIERREAKTGSTYVVVRLVEDGDEVEISTDSLTAARETIDNANKGSK